MDHVSNFIQPQTNEFRCTHCDTHIEVEAVPHVPVYPCQACGYVAWEIYKINDTLIYPHRS